MIVFFLILTSSIRKKVMWEDSARARFRGRDATEAGRYYSKSCLGPGGAPHVKRTPTQECADACMRYGKNPTLPCTERGKTQWDIREYTWRKIDEVVATTSWLSLNTRKRSLPHDGRCSHARRHVRMH